MKYPSLKQGKSNTFTVSALKGGCNLREGEKGIADSQLVRSENVWWKDGALRTRPGVRMHSRFEMQRTDKVEWRFCAGETTHGNIYGKRFLHWETGSTEHTIFRTGILSYDGNYYVEGVFTYPYKDIFAMPMEYPYTAEEDLLIFLSDGEIYAFNRVKSSWRKVTGEAHVPCVRSETSSGKVVTAGRNLLSDSLYAEYTTDGNVEVFYLPVKNIEEDSGFYVELLDENGEVINHSLIPFLQTTGSIGGLGLRAVINRRTGGLWFQAEDGSRATPPKGCLNNLTIISDKSRTVEEIRRIPSMTFSEWFGGSQAGSESRHFFSGCTDKKNCVYWSEQGQPLYFPETNCVSLGDPEQAVTAFGKQDNMLVVFKEREIYSLSELQTADSSLVDGQLYENKINTDLQYYPVTRLHGRIGCTAPKTVQLCGNRLIWADGMGKVHMLIGNASDGYQVRELSYLISHELEQYTTAQWKDAVAGVWKGHYILIISNTAYVLRTDEKAFRQYENEYDDDVAGDKLAWFIWKLPEIVKPWFLLSNGKDLMGLTVIEKDDGLQEVPFGFCENAGDFYFRQGEYGLDPITAYLRTKEYDFGKPFANKRILRVYLGMDTDEHAIAQFYYISGGEIIGEATEMRGDSEQQLVTLTPNYSRAKRLGFGMKTKGCIALDMLSFTYRY